MKKFIILFLLAGIATGHAQVIQLDEAKVEAKAVKVTTSNGDLKVSVAERFSNQFVKDPISFLKQNINLPQIAEELKSDRNESYSMELRCKKGYLVAKFNDQGKLLSTSQRFKNIAVPLSVSRDLLKDHKGWIMTKNLYVASGKEDLLDKELYRITLKNGKKTKIVKIIPKRPERGLASY